MSCRGDPGLEQVINRPRHHPSLEPLSVYSIDLPLSAAVGVPILLSWELTPRACQGCYCRKWSDGVLATPKTHASSLPLARV